MSDEVEIEIAVEGPAAVVSDLEAVEVGLLCRGEIATGPGGGVEGFLDGDGVVGMSSEDEIGVSTVVRPVPAASASPKSLMATSMVGASLVPVKVTRSCCVAGGAMPSETEMS